MPFDPFDVFRVSELELRGRLRRLAGSELLAMIDRYALNNARKSLARLSDSQLVTFIVTAVEVQLGVQRHA